jgi:hypothetical protein
MNNIKLLGLTAGVSTLIFAGNATADFNGISWTSSSSAYGDTYLIYADVDAGSQLNAVYGDDNVALNIEGTSAFYQNAFGGATVASMNPAFFPVFPSLVYDSFVTIGLVTNVGNAMLDIGIDFTDFNAGGAIMTSNGSWFATPDDAQVQEIDGKVLIGQFTVADGEGVSGTINMQGFNADGTVWIASDISFNTVPAPGALALLGLAGIAARRRRK